MATQQWVPPLPPGYEARWDPNQRAYFFVDHSTKTTSWQDPRYPPKPVQDPKLHQQPQSQHQQPQSQHQQLQSQHQQATKDEEVKDDMTKMQEIKFKFHSAPDEVIKKCLKETNNSVVKTMNKLHDLGYKQETGLFPPSKRVGISKKLRAAFPGVSPEIINDVLEECHDDENRAHENLKSLGFKPEVPATAKVPSSTVSQKGSSTSTIQKGTSANGNQRGPTIIGSQKGTSSNVGQMKSASATSSAAKSVIPTAAPVKPQLSEEHKQSMIKKFQGMFTSCEKSVIEMALQVCEYEESRVKNVLEKVNTVTESHPVATTTASGGSHAQSSSSVQTFDAASLEPVKLFDDEPRPGSSSPSKESTPVRVTSAIQKGSDLSSRPSTGKSTTAVPQKSVAAILATSQSYQHRAKQVTHPGQSSAQTVVSRQPERSGHLSQNRIQAKGPDPSLYVGPNKNLLLSEYIMAKGPKQEMCQGHDPGRAKGSHGAVGPNKTLHCGPQSNMVQGHVHENNNLVTAV